MNFHVHGRMEMDSFWLNRPEKNQDLREQTIRPLLLFVTVTVLLQTRAVKHLDMIVHLLYSGLPAHLTRRENIFSKSHVIGNHFKVSRTVSLACTDVTLSPIVHKSKKFHVTIFLTDLNFHFSALIALQSALPLLVVVHDQARLPLRLGPAQTFVHARHQFSRAKQGQ